MSRLTPSKSRGHQARVSILGSGLRVSITGPASAVVALVAILGLILITIKVIEYKERTSESDTVPLRFDGR